MLEFKNVTKFYGDIKAVEDISFTVHEGEICGLLGENGAGKSTLIKIAGGVIKFEFGDILLNGISIKKDSVRVKKNISYVPDIPYIYNYMNPIEFWNFILDIYEVDSVYGIKMIEKYSSAFGIDDVVNQPISSFSKGMRQKVSLIAAFIHPSVAYVLDEPFSGLDSRSVVTLESVMKEKANNNCCVLFSTHSFERVKKICNRTVSLKKGRVDTDEICRNISIDCYGSE